jgi:hypothetical protein
MTTQCQILFGILFEILNLLQFRNDKYLFQLTLLTYNFTSLSLNDQN